MKALFSALFALVATASVAQAEVKPVGTFLSTECSRSISGENLGINPITQICLGYRVGIPGSFAISTRRLHGPDYTVYDVTEKVAILSKGTKVVQQVTLMNTKTGAEVKALITTIGGFAGTEVLSITLDDGSLEIEATGFEHMAHTL